MDQGRILFLLILGLIFLVGPNLLFWWAYRFPIEGTFSGLVLIGKGLVAGLAAWTWLFPGIATFATGYSGAEWVYGVFVAPVVGIIFVAFFDWLIKISGVSVRLLGRLVMGACVGIISGIVVGGLLNLNSPYPGNNLILTFVVFFTPIGCASAIMVGKHGAETVEINFPR